MADGTGGRSGPAASGSVGGTGSAGLIGVETRGTFCVAPSWDGSDRFARLEPVC